MNISGLHVYLFYGRKGSGKSLYMAYLAHKLFRSYAKVEKKYVWLPKRQLYSNIKFSREFELKHQENLRYWTHPEELYEVRNSDIFWDEIGKDMPAGCWADTSKELRQVFSHLRKRGNRIFANTQVYEDVDIAVRRQTDVAYEVKKRFGSRDISATLPPPKVIWGLMTLTKFDPMQIEVIRDPEGRAEVAKTNWFIFPEFVIINRKLVSIYDTTTELPPYQPNTLKEIILICREGEECQNPHRDGGPHKIIRHVPV